MTFSQPPRAHGVDIVPFIGHRYAEADCPECPILSHHSFCERCHLRRHAGVNLPLSEFCEIANQHHHAHREKTRRKDLTIGCVGKHRRKGDQRKSADARNRDILLSRCMPTNNPMPSAIASSSNSPNIIISPYLRCAKKQVTSLETAAIGLDFTELRRFYLYPVNHIFCCFFGHRQVSLIHPASQHGYTTE